MVWASGERGKIGRLSISLKHLWLCLMSILSNHWPWICWYLHEMCILYFLVCLSCDRFIDTYTFNSGMQIAMRGEDASQMKTIDVHFFMTHINGYTFRMQPNGNFNGLAPGAYETLRITGGGWAVSRSEVRCIFLCIGCHGKNWLLFSKCCTAVRTLL